MKQLYTIFIWFIPTILFAQVGTLPERTIENTPDGVIVTYLFPEATIYENFLYPNSFFWLYAGFGMNDKAGEPSFPFRTDMFVIPAGNEAEIAVIATAYTDTLLSLSPAVPNLPEDDTPLVIDSINPYEGFFPNSIIEHDTLQYYRGVGLQRVTIIPIQYNCMNHVVRTYSMVKYKVSFVQAAEEDASSTFQSTDDFLSNVTLNYGRNRANRINAQDSIWHTAPSTRPYLIVTTNEYLDSIQDFVEWKRTKGNQIFITSKSKGTWTTTAVTDSISFYFQEFGIQNVLIIGGFSDVPAKNMSYSGYTGVTDYLYGLPGIEGSLPQIHRGRIPADTSAEVKRILDKICHYEQNPVQDTAFYHNALHCAQFQDTNRDGYEDRAFTLVSENIRHHLTTNCSKTIHRVYYAENSVSPTCWNKPTFSTGQPIPEDIRPDVFSWNGKAEDIRELIDEGVFYVLHRDHGSIKGWGQPCFKDTSIVKLQNREKLPVVFSLNCSTGSYQYSGDCFTEAFLKHQNGGCVGIFGATATSFSGYNDAMALGMFDAIWPNLQPIYTLNGYSYTSSSQPIYELGSILDQGLQRMSETWGLNRTSGRVYTWKLFHCFGDPSMRIYTETPNNFAEPLVFSRNDSIFVFVEDGDCRITFYNKATKEVKSYEGNYASYVNPTDELIICLDRHNYVPYIWDCSKDMYIQNEDITNETRVYKGNIIHIGNHVTNTKPSGNVNIQNSQVTITGNGLDLQPGTYIDKNFIFQNQ